MCKPRTCPIRTQKDAFWTQKDAFWTPKSALGTRVRRTNGQVFQKKAQHYRTRRIWFREVFSEKAFKKGPLETPGIYIWMGKSWDKLPTSMLAGFPSIVPLGKHQPNNSVACQECAWCGFWSLRLRQPNLNSGSWFLLYRSDFFDFLYVFSKKRVGFWK